MNQNHYKGINDKSSAPRSRRNQAKQESTESFLNRGSSIERLKPRIQRRPKSKVRITVRPILGRVYVAYRIGKKGDC